MEPSSIYEQKAREFEWYKQRYFQKIAMLNA